MVARGEPASATHTELMRTLHHLCTALLLAGVGGWGCIIHDDPEIRITSLRVTGESDWGRLDVEVHLYDAVTHQHLGCAGDGEGLEDVDANDITYRLDAWFREPVADVALHPSVLDGRTVELQVMENDTSPCPEPPHPEDDVIGISPPLGRAAFDAGATLAFDRVVELRVVAD